jgi:hypothetical protein
MTSTSSKNSATPLRISERIKTPSKRKLEAEEQNSYFATKETPTKKSKINAKPEVNLFQIASINIDKNNPHMKNISIQELIDMPMTPIPGEEDAIHLLYPDFDELRHPKHSENPALATPMQPEPSAPRNRTNSLTSSVISNINWFERYLKSSKMDYIVTLKSA